MESIRPVRAPLEQGSGSIFKKRMRKRMRALICSLCPILPFLAGVRDKTVHVAAGGKAEYSSVQQAIDAAPPEGGVVISIAPGTYREVLEITRQNVQLRGVDPDPRKTVIVFDRSSGTTGGTMKSATVNVRADNFRAENLTFANDFNTTHPQLPQGSQALALLVTGDRAVFRHMRFLGNQDTLYAANKSCNGPNGEPCTPARQYFSHCYIEGNVDFIFGDGKAVFEECEIHSTQAPGRIYYRARKALSESGQHFHFQPM